MRFALTSTRLAIAGVLLAIGGRAASAQSPRLGTADGLTVPLGLDAIITVPDDNPLTPEKVALGRDLFTDRILSLDRTRSCASCHRPDHAFADTARISSGVRGRHVARNAPTLLNRGYGKAFFWDGRAATLEDGVLLPIDNPDELALPLADLVTRLRASTRYRALFRRAFPAREITRSTVGQALASYVRTLRSGDTPADRYVAGDTTALSAAQRRGRALFLGKGNCADCHSGPTFSDERFHNTGVAAGTTDEGRHVITRDSADRGRFKTPTLREIVRTAPYMHDGSIPTLERVVDFYDGGGRANPNLDQEIHPLRLSAAEKSDLIAFLRALGGGPQK